MRRPDQPVRGWLAAIFLAAAASTAFAVIEIAPLSNAQLEQRYRDLIDELRCPKCQNQNLADSNSPIAADLREQVRVLLEEGKSDEEIIAFLVDRYGEFVRYRPALKSDTALLWFAPGVLMLVGLGVIFLVVRANRQAAGGAGELSPAERRRLDELLAEKNEAPGKTDSGEPGE